MRTKRMVRGNPMQGRRPCIEYEGVRYTGKVMTRNLNLIGQELELDIDPYDIRTIDVYEEDGSYLDTVTPVGTSPLTMAQTLDQRRAMLQSRTLCVPVDASRSPELAARHPSAALPGIPTPNRCMDEYRDPKRKHSYERANEDQGEIKPCSLDHVFSRLVREYPGYTEQTLELHSLMMQLTELHEGLLNIIADLE